MVIIVILAHYYIEDKSIRSCNLALQTALLAYKEISIREYAVLDQLSV